MIYDLYFSRLFKSQNIKNGLIQTKKEKYVRSDEAME